MGQAAAKQGDQIIATDIHIVILPPPASSPTPLPHTFNGIIKSNLSSNVNIMGKPAATEGSMADNNPPHLPPPGTAFQHPPSNKATIKIGSPTVKINGKMAARNGDIAETCNDPTPLPVGQVVAIGTVFVG